MNLRLLAREARDYPATFLFCASWLIVFAAMVLANIHDASPTFNGVLLTGMGEGRRFGDLTLRDLSNGEYWRLVTCNFVHYSVIHIGMNLFAFYLLGTLLESWYGSWALVAIYGATGVGGNLLSTFARRVSGASPLVHSGGGSVVIMGLIGLCAAAGWVSRSERDRELTWQMLKALAITGALGLAFPRYIDNWGHAGGALVGLPIGLFHPRLLGARGRLRSVGPGLIWLVVLLASGAAQVRSDRVESDARRLVRLRHELDACFGAYRALQYALQWSIAGGDARGVEAALRAQAPLLDAGATRPLYRRLLFQAAEYTRRKPTQREREAFRLDAQTLAASVREAALPRLKSYWRLRRDEPPPTSATGPPAAAFRPAPR